MSDDIDIEEHDVMDNPRVRDMFPDLVQVKMEIPDEDEVHESEETDFSSHYPDSEPQSFNTYQYQLTGYREDTDDKCQFHTKIILGTKPTRQSQEDNLNAFVLLENWGPTLERSACFCNECNILFPTVNALDSHKMSSHSFLIAIDNPSRNVAIKSTAKSKDAPPKLCNHCQNYFQDDDALVKHLYELLPLNNYFCKKCDDAFQTNEALLAHQCSQTSDIEDVEWDYCCPVCSISYVYLNALTTHMNIDHGVLNFAVKKSKRSGKCSFCEYESNLRSTFNKHIRRRHPNIFFDKTGFQCPKTDSDSHTVKGDVKDKITKPKIKQPLTKFTLIPKSTLFKCSKCPIHFLSTMQIYNHEKMCSTSSARCFTCTICSRKLKYKDMKFHRLQHKNSTKLNVYTYSAKLINRILMKCCNCEVFFEQRCFWTHFYTCNKNTRFFHCSLCKVNISYASQGNHIGIHKELKTKSDVFIKIHLLKIHKLNSNLETKVLKNTTSVEKITTSVKRKVDCLIDDNYCKSEVPSKKSRINFKIFYCEYCECYVTNLSRHTICKKDGNVVTKHSCDKCAMTFTNRTALSGHKDLHKRLKIKLSDFTFLSIHTEKPILPPIPTFDKCEHCGVCFNKYWSLHVCYENKVITCNLCDIKYTQQVYRVHMPYHKYSLDKFNTSADIMHDSKGEETLPVLIKRYKALNKTWHILYSCKYCDVITDAYDDVVDHSQNHLGGDEDAESSTCNICNLNFLKTAFTRHRELHSRNSNISRKSFKIIDYDYKRLLNSNWLDTFNNLPEIQFQQIVSQSIYNATCEFKMRLHRDGPASMTMYQCEKCRCYLHSASLHTHVMFCSGLKRKSLYCRECKIYFTTHTNLIKHSSLHTSKNINLKSFRIIRYNSENDKPYKVLNKTKKDYNVYRCKKCRLYYCRKKNALRHIRCPPNTVVCKICKLGYNVRHGFKHKVFHEQNPRFENKNITFQDFDPEEIRKEDVAEIYRCRCGLHFTSLKNIKKHESVCESGQELSKVSCSKCGLLFPTDLLVTHLCIHHRDKKPTKFLIKKLMPKGTKKNESQVFTGDETKHVLYKCSTCDVHFLKRSSVLRHLQLGAHEFKKQPKKCPYCGLKFSVRSSVFHKLRHHNGKISELEVIVDPSIGNNPLTYTVQMNDKLHKPIKIKKYKSNVIKTQQSGRVYMKEKEVEHHEYFDLKKYVYKCFKCPMHCLSASALAFHLNSGCHQPPVDCDVCGLAFSELTMSRHKKYHHKLRKKAIPIEISADHNIRENTVPSFDKIPLYKCTSVPGYFSALSFLQSYIVRCKNKDMKNSCYRCPVCRYDFPLSALESHFKIHHIKNNRKRDDFYVVQYDFNDVDPSKKDNIGSFTENVNSSLEVEAISTVNGSISINETINSNDNVDLPTYAGSINVDVTITRNTDNQSDYSKIDLFKCIECNVHFVNQSTCYKHMYKHVPFSLKSLVDCKFCHLQFTLKSLKIHLSKHHNERLEIDEIMIKEYWQTSEGLKTKWCRVTDKLQSKQISTTTAQDDDVDSMNICEQ